MKNDPHTATLNIEGNTITLPILTGTKGPSVININQLGQAGYFTFDPGFVSTAACTSEITFIDGGKGTLLHRGYPIDQLATQHDFMEVAYLLFQGSLPNPAEKTQFYTQIQQHQACTDTLQKIAQAFPTDAHPMSMLISLVGGLSTPASAEENIQDAAYQQNAAHTLIAKMASLVALTYRHNQNQSFIAPDPELSYSANLLHMLFGDREDQPHQNATYVRAMDRILILHADHEQNASTSTVRLAGSTGADPFAAVAAGIAALWGPRHGGANEACLTMLQEIGDIAHINTYLEKAKDPNDPFRLMGFGHRVYRNYDPRAHVMRKTCHEILDELDKKDYPIFQLALALEKIAVEDAYFVQRKLYPNVDFYSGIILNALGIPTNLFTALFALSRTVGWMAHWMEMVNSPDFRIGRPRQLYRGEPQRDL